MKFNNIITAIVIMAALTACNKEQDNGRVYAVNEKTSLVEWKGIASDHFHTGAFDLTGNIKTEDGKITSGAFIIPISSISNYDLPDTLKIELLNHLKGTDFFNVAVHPNAKFILRKTEALDKSDTLAASRYNYRVTGDFSMIGQTHEINFPAKITLADDSLYTTAAFKLNRLKWGMNSFNDPSKPLYLLPNVEIKLDVKAAVEKD